MITALETKVLETFRKLSLEKQEQVINLLEIMEKESNKDELELANQIRNNAKKNIY